MIRFSLSSSSVRVRAVFRPIFIVNVGRKQHVYEEFKLMERSSLRSHGRFFSTTSNQKHEGKRIQGTGAKPSNHLSSENGDKENNNDNKKEEKSGGLMLSIKNGISSLVDMIKNPAATWIFIKEVALHYWVGSKLLWSEMKMAIQILKRIVQGHDMTRRERLQLVRTAMDVFRLVPFSIFVIVPFMELLLPVALKLFPNMLPSTFQDDLKKEEAMKAELQMRLAVAGFFQETLQEMAKKKKGGASDGDDASAGKEVIDFIEKARLGEPMPKDTVIRIAGHFKDELTLANIARPQLVSMCQYMGLQPFGADAFLRYQLRTKLRALKEDDRRILWEGIESLTMAELREACTFFLSFLLFYELFV